MLPSTPLRECLWITPSRLRLLERSGFETVEQLLTHFPKRYEDRRRFDHFPNDESGEAVCVCGVVKKTNLRRLRAGQKMFDVLIEEETAPALSGPLTLRWFNAHWIEKMIAVGHRVVVFGKPKRSGSQVVISHPEIEIADDDAESSIHLQRIVPVHRATEGLPPRVMRRVIWDTLAQLEAVDFPPRLPAALDRWPRVEALRQIHFPDDDEQRKRARQHLVLEEFFAMQLTVAARRREHLAQAGAAHGGSGALLERLRAGLPFALTGAQERAIAEIRADLASPQPMNRLLHGDVGSGKTLVALAGMLLCVEAGFQAALMAPTQILAEQHFLTLRRLCEPLGLRVSLRTGARKEDATPLPLFAASAAGPGGALGPSAAVGGSPTAPGARYSRNRLPHFEQPWAVYAVAFNTHDPRRLNEAARDAVLGCILHWKDRRYRLLAACVMPDHVHLLIQPTVKENAAEGSSVFFSLTEILHTIKSRTAHQINSLEHEHGALWQQEWFDRFIRSERDLAEKVDYILRNPWSSGVVREGEEYRWCWSVDRELESGVTRPPAFEAGRLEPHASGMHYPDHSAPHLVVGTHALLYEGAGLENLGLAVIDEQHKFGVMQRARLIQRGVAPDVLVMTATPIPRTLTMTLYGDLDVSVLDELPANRGKIITALRGTKKLPDIVKFLREQLAAGRQAYVVYPLIEESERLEAKAAAGEFARWQELVAPAKCELLHGRVPPEEKDAIMDRFRRGETHVLIATTVIEVGIDVPNASMMLIESAERFGLAQLHQLRGRIGRGQHTSYCVLISDSKDEDALAKLRTLERTVDGFEIAEADLRMRGAGDLLGTAQSGLPPLKLGDLFADADLMKLARNAAFLLFERDPGLEQPEHRQFRALLAADRRAALGHVS